MNSNDDREQSSGSEHPDNQDHWQELLPETPSSEATRTMDLDDQQMVRLEIGSASF